MGGNTVVRQWVKVTVFYLATLFGWGMILPPVVLLAGRTAVALHAAIRLYPDSGWAGMVHGIVGTRNLSSFWQAGFRTMAIAAVSIAAAMLIALPASFAIAKVHSSARAFGQGLALALAGIPLYVTVSGVVRAFSLAWLVDPVSPGRTLLAAGLISGIGLAPLATLAAAAAWLSISRECEEAGLLLASPLRVWRKITLPLGAGGVAATCALVGVLSACDMTVSDALAVRSWAEEIYLAFNLELDSGKAAISALPLTLLSAAGMGILLWRGGRMAARTLSGRGSSVYRFDIGRWRLPAGCILLAAAAVMVWPFADLLWAGFSSNGGGLAWSDVFGVSLTTIVCSGAGSGIALLLALPLSMAACRSRGLFLRIGIASAALLLICLPTPLFGYAIASFWNQPWWNSPALSWLPRLFYDTPLSVVALYAIQTLSPAILLLWAVFRQIPSVCLDAAGTLSIRPCSALFRIVLPIGRDGILLSWAVCYLLTLRELGGLVLTAPPGWSFLTVRYATQIHFGVYADLAFLLAMSLPVVLLPPLALVHFTGRNNASLAKRGGLCP